MNIYNTATKSVEVFKPRVAGKVGLYACGPTVYDYAHLGHLRKYTMDDVLIRVLKHEGYEVNFVENVTDVGHLTSDGDTGEDKLEKGAKKYGKSAWDVAKEFEEYYWKSMGLMGNLHPDVVARATEHIPEQLAMVMQLEKLGHTYEIPEDGIYFDTATFPEYGEMAQLKLDDQQVGDRVGDVAGKRNASDFALWKFERPGEDRAMIWPSPWSERSFPGWHIECSAMSMKYLGDQFDIHTGGIDHIPVHHTNEIAQAEAATGKKPFVAYWVHHNFLRVDGEKMSKSLNNFFTIDDVMKRGFEPMALRLLFLGAHYRSELNFTWESLAGAAKAWKKLQDHWLRLQVAEMPSGKEGASNDQTTTIMQSFFTALDDDLNTAQAVAIMWSMLKDTTLLDSNKKAALLQMVEVLGLDLEAKAIGSEDGAEEPERFSQVPPHVQALVDQRQEARKSKNYSLADSLRAEIESHGFTVEDIQGGSVVVVPVDKDERAKV